MFKAIAELFYLIFTTSADNETETETVVPTAAETSHLVEDIFVFSACGFMLLTLGLCVRWIKRRVKAEQKALDEMAARQIQIATPTPRSNKGPDSPAPSSSSIELRQVPMPAFTGSLEGHMHPDVPIPNVVPVAEAPVNPAPVGRRRTGRNSQNNS